MRAIIVWLHGLGDSGAGWAHLKRELGLKNVHYVLPDAPDAPVSCNGGMEMPSWMDLVKIPVEPADKDDVPGLSQSKATVHKVIDDAIASGTPSDQIVVGGFSQGGAMALLSGYTYPKPLAGVVSFSGWATLRDDLQTYVSEGANAKTPAFIGHGTADQVVTPECGGDASQRLNQAGVPVTYNTYPMQHGSHPAEMAALRTWLVEVLKLQEP